MTWGVAEGWQLAAPRMGVLTDFRESRNAGIKTAMNIEGIKTSFSSKATPA